MLVLEDPSERQTKRSIRIRRILKAAAASSDELSVDVVLVKRKDVRAAFAQFGATNKQDIAEIIARKMEAFAVRLPRARKAWQAEDHRMAVFDAASRGLTYYYRLDSNGQ